MARASTSTPTPEREVQKREAATLLQELLSGLRTHQRVVFTMFEIEGLTCEQISAQIGVPAGTVYSRLHRARKAFALRLKRQRERESRHFEPPSR